MQAGCGVKALVADVAPNMLLKVRLAEANECPPRSSRINRTQQSA